MDFKGERDVIQQNGLQGQNQYGFIVSTTCCNFRGGICLQFFSFKMKSDQASFKSAHLLNKMALVQSQRNRTIGYLLSLRKF